MFTHRLACTLGILFATAIYFAIFSKHFAALKEKADRAAAEATISKRSRCRSG